MNAPHVIRLRGPWVRRVNADDDGARVTLPGDWSADLGAGFQGCVSYHRNFHRPPGLESDEPVALVLHEVVGDAEVWLNELRLGRACWPLHPHRFDVTGKLFRSNELRIEIKALSPHERRLRLPETPDDKTGGLVGEVCLEFG